MRKILIVDDEKEFCNMIKEQLETASSFDVEICTNGAQAFEKAKAIRPELIILDIMMPGKTGPEIAAQLKSSVETTNIPIIFLTAVLNEEEAKKQKHVIGGEYFLGKPVKISDLLYMVNHLLP